LRPSLSVLQRKERGTGVHDGCGAGETGRLS
jgi:hypothetical protein